MDLTDLARLGGLGLDTLISLSLPLVGQMIVPMPSVHMVPGDLNLGPTCLYSEHFAESIGPIPCL